MIGLIFGDTDFPNKILKTIKKRKIKYLIIDLKFGFVTFPANKTFLQFLDFNIEIILPNWPIETA